MMFKFVRGKWSCILFRKKMTLWGKQCAVCQFQQSYCTDSNGGRDEKKSMFNISTPKKAQKMKGTNVKGKTKLVIEINLKNSIKRSFLGGLYVTHLPIILMCPSVCPPTFAQELHLEVKRSTRKPELNWLIIEQLFDKDLLPDCCFEMYELLPVELSVQFEIRQLEIERELDLKSLKLNTEKKSLKLNNEKKSLKLNKDKKSLKLNNGKKA